MTLLGKVMHSVALLCTLFAASEAAVYDRPLAIVYARLQKALPMYTDQQLLARFDLVTNGITAVVPWFLNTPNVERFANMTQELNNRGIVLVPAVGGTRDNGPINQQSYKDIAAGYRNVSKYIRLEGLQLYYDYPDNRGPAEVQDMIDYLTLPRYGLQFEHVMLNPWPRPRGGGVVHYANPQVDATINEVTLNFTRSPPYPITPDPDNWKPNEVRVSEMRDYNRSIPILINYENAPQQLALNKTERDSPGASKRNMNITITGCIPERLHWTPPFSENYDPIAFGTWIWIANRLSEFQ